MTPEERYNELNDKYASLLNAYAEESRRSAIMKTKLQGVLDTDFSKLGASQVLKQSVQDLLKAIFY